MIAHSNSAKFEQSDHPPHHLTHKKQTSSHHTSILHTTLQASCAHISFLVPCPRHFYRNSNII